MTAQPLAGPYAPAPHPVPDDAPAAARELVERHREALEAALRAVSTREYHSRYPESPSPRVYGEGAAEAGQRAFEAHLTRRFDELSGQPATDAWVGSEVSPYGPALRVGYPHPDVPALMAAVTRGQAAWRDAGAEVRAAVCLEAVDRIHARSFEMAHAVMHTSGQPFVMAFQAAGPHAQDRALEAVAYALFEQRRVPASVVWEKPAKGEPLRMVKDYRVVPRGVALVIGCNTFPTWNSYPGLFASLATGNAVLVKPHPKAVLPLAISVAAARDVLAEAGFDPNLITLVAEQPGEKIAAELALRPEVKIIDFTGSSAFGEWLEENARQAQVYTEKAGVNTIVIDSTDDYTGMLNNVAFSLSLYTGQMCTAPQNLLIPRDGITADGEHTSFDQVTADLAGAVDALLGEEKRAVEILRAVVNDDVLGRIDGATGTGKVVLASRAVDHPAFPGATI